VTLNLSLICQISYSGSGHIRYAGTNYPSPGLAKIAPWWLAHRDSFSAKVPGLVSADGATKVYSLNRRAVSIQAWLLAFAQLSWFLQCDLDSFILM